MHQAVRSRPVGQGKTNLRARSFRRGVFSVKNMFTGIVQGMATVAEVSKKENFSAIKINFPEDRISGIQIGARWSMFGD
jgi:hypothetical protein